MTIFVVATANLLGGLLCGFLLGTIRAWRKEDQDWDRRHPASGPLYDDATNQR